MRDIDNQINIKRKCGYCGKYLYINNNNIDNAIYYDNKTYHSSCFINLCKTRTETNKKNVSTKWGKALNEIELIKCHSREHFSEAITKESIFKFIREVYDVTVIPTTVWHKLSSIYNGTFKGMSRGIQPEHLFDMWKRKIDLLNKIAYENSNKGITMSSSNRISYDLSILVNKYDSYLKWLKKQQVVELESKLEKKEMDESIITNGINYISSETTNESKDISDLVDDIFG